MSQDLAIAVCHFNWCNYTNPIRNLNRFLLQMDTAGLPVFGMELRLNSDFETKNRPNWKQIEVSQEHILFQRESCINLLAKIIPQQFTKIAWIDPDLHFTNSNWYEETSKKLDKFKLVQLFDSYVSTDRYGRYNGEIPSMMKMGGPTKKIKGRVHIGQPGAAWAARREFWQCGGLYNYSIMGGGDTALIYSLYDEINDSSVMEMSGIFDINSPKLYRNWKDPITAYVNKEVSYVSGKIVHEWHGDRPGRKYGKRYDIVKSMDRENCLRVGVKNLTEIINVDQSVYQSIFNYFKDRNEDGV